MPHLRTERLTLVPFTLEMADAALNDRAALPGLLGVSVPDSWPQPDFAEIMPEVLESRRKDPSEAEWSALITHTTDGTLIGDIGFFGPPREDGTVEFGYSIVPEYRDKGYATEAARAMIAWALDRPDVQRVYADCLKDNLASIRVLEKLGMRSYDTTDELIKWIREK